MTPEQERAIAIANARRRAAEAEARSVVDPPAPPPRESAESIEPSWGKRYAAGAGQAVDRALDSITQMVLSGEEGASKALEDTIKEKRRVDQALSEDTAGTLGNISGNVAMTAVPATRVVKGLAATTKAPQIFKNAMMARRGQMGPALNTVPSRAVQTGAGYGGAAVTGAAGGAALLPTVGDETRAENAAEGGAFGVLGQGVGNLLAKPITGLIKKSKEALELPYEVAKKATLGQVADAKTWLGNAVGRLEEGAQSLPLVGSVFRNARRKGSEAWRGELLGRVSPPNYSITKGNPTVRDTIDELQDAFTARYQGALRGTNIVVDPGFSNQVNQIVTNPRNGLTAQQADQVRELVSRYHDSMFPPANQAATVTGDIAKDFESFLTTQARNLRRSTAAEAPNLANVYSQIEQAWTNVYRSQLPQQARMALQPLDDLYAQFKTVEKAAGALGNEGGAFTPSQLLSSVKSRTSLPGFAAGQGLLQKDAQAGKVVFGDKLPDSGSAERGFGAGFGFGMLAQAPEILAGSTLGVPLFTTQVGKNVMTGDTALQKILQRLRAPQALTAVGGPTGSAIWGQVDNPVEE